MVIIIKDPIMDGEEVMEAMQGTQVLEDFLHLRPDLEVHPQVALEQPQDLEVPVDDKHVCDVIYKFTKFKFILSIKIVNS